MANGTTFNEPKITTKMISYTIDEYGQIFIPNSSVDNKTILHVAVHPSTTDAWKYTIMRQTIDTFRAYYVYDGKNGWDWVKNVTINIQCYLYG